MLYASTAFSILLLRIDSLTAIAGPVIITIGYAGTVTIPQNVFHPRILCAAAKCLYAVKFWFMAINPPQYQDPPVQAPRLYTGYV